MRNDLVLSEIDGRVARLTLNDPARANVLSTGMMSALRAALAEAAADSQVRVIVLGAAGRIFCAGHDLAELRATESADAHAELFALCSALMLQIRGCRAPVIARVQGWAVAAGCQLVAACDLAYAAEGVAFGVSGIDLG